MGLSTVAFTIRNVREVLKGRPTNSLPIAMLSILRATFAG